jgi:hypothetical protein
MDIHRHGIRKPRPYTVFKIVTDQIIVQTGAIRSFIICISCHVFSIVFYYLLNLCFTNTVLISQTALTFAKFFIYINNLDIYE